MFTSSFHSHLLCEYLVLVLLEDRTHMYLYYILWAQKQLFLFMSYNFSLFLIIFFSFHFLLRYLKLPHLFLTKGL